MSEITGQLLSTRLQQLAGEAAGHTNESAQYEITFDNPIDIEATNIKLIYSLENLCWAILDNGPGAKNIDNLWGTGEGIKIKNGDKIGNKIAGELAAATFFQPNRLMYFSRCNNSITGRKHQQLNAQMHKMVQTVKTHNIDLTVADNMITKGPNKLVRKPEPDSDKFDNDNVAYVKEIFKNNIHIINYFDTECTGMIKIFKYEDDNKTKFIKLITDLPMILNKVKFITYNTLKVFRGTKTFESIDIDNGTNNIINTETCNKNSILGSKAILEDKHNAEEDIIEDETFGIIGEKVLYFWNIIYEYKNINYNKCLVLNYDEEDEFLLGEQTKKYLGKKSNLQTINNKHIICTDENKKAEFPIMLSLIDKDEAENQKTVMKENTLESLKQVYIYYQGRFIAKCKAPITGLQERSLPNFRIVIVLNENTINLVNIRAQKSSISLDTADPIIIKTIDEILKPIINKYSAQNGCADIIKNGISSWKPIKNDILRVLGVPIPILASVKPNPVPPPIPIPIPLPIDVAIPVPVPPIPEPSKRGPAPIVLASLNKAQSIQQLKRLKIKLNSGKYYTTKADKKKIYTVINNIEKDIVIDDDIMTDKIDNLIEILLTSDKKDNETIKHAASLQEL
jgi:hypothetical protein